MGGRLHRGGEGDGGAGGEVGDCALMMAITCLINREALVALLTCSCGCLCLPPVAQCRKGHIYCRCNFSFPPVNVSQDFFQGLLECQPANVYKMQAGIKFNWNVKYKPKQTVVDAPNLALDRLMGFFALPCNNKGCNELLYLNKMESHLESCKFRLQSCPNTERGCKAKLPAKVGRSVTTQN